MLCQHPDELIRRLHCTAGSQGDWGNCVGMGLDVSHANHELLAVASSPHIPYVLYSCTPVQISYRYLNPKAVINPPGFPTVSTRIQQASLAVIGFLVIISPNGRS